MPFSMRAVGMQTSRLSTDMLKRSTFRVSSTFRPTADLGRQALIPRSLPIWGKVRNHYKQEAALKRLLGEFSKKHSYTVRLERFLVDIGKRRDKGTKKRNRALALKIIHSLDGAREVRRADIVQQLLADQSRYTAEEVDSIIAKLHNAKLIRSQRGRYARVQIA